MSSNDETRLDRVNKFLENAHAELFKVVTACAKHVPMRDIATMIDGDDEAGVFKAYASSRGDIARMLLGRAEKEGELDEQILSLAKYEAGLLPCVFLVKIPGGITEVSVVALRMEVIN